MQVIYLTILTTVLSFVYMFIRNISPKFMDTVILPILVWSTSLTALSTVVFISRFGIVPGIFMIIFLWKIIYSWLSYVSDKTGNKKLKNSLDNFDMILKSPFVAMTNLWDTLINALASATQIVTESWGFIVKSYKEVINFIPVAWNEMNAAAVALYYTLIDAFKKLWDQNIKLLRLIVSMGGTIDEDITPPLPEQFVKTEYPQSTSTQVSVGQTFEQQAASIVSAASFFR